MQSLYFAGRAGWSVKLLTASILSAVVAVVITTTGFVLPGRWFAETEYDLFVAANALVCILAGVLSFAFMKFLDVRAESRFVQNALDMAEARQREILQNLPVGVATVSLADGRLIDTNAEFLRIADGGERIVADLLGLPDAPPYARKLGKTGNASVFGSPTRKPGESTGNICHRVVPFPLDPLQPKWLSLSLIRLDQNADSLGEAVIVANDITSRRNLEIQLQSLLKRFVNAQEEERLRISRELHDEMGQELTAMALQFKNLEQETEDLARRSVLSSMRDSVERLSIRTHDIAAQLRPMSLNEFGLAKAVDDLIDNFQERTGIIVDTYLDGLERIENPEIALTIYRVIQEALTNIARHSSAISASITVQRSGDELRIAIEDDGRGFDIDETVSQPDIALGLTGMRERLVMVGGSLSIESEVGRGTAVFACMPLANLSSGRLKK